MQYTDIGDITVEVGQDHIETAIKIYNELSKLSPSRKVSWKKHKEMMEVEGFFDSSTTESYRQLIKRERARVGELPEKAKFAELASQGTLDSIKEEIGQLYFHKREAQDDFLKLSKLKREMTRDIVLFDILSESIKESDWGSIELNKGKYIPSSGNVALATLSDIHYGYEGKNNYTTEELEPLLDKYADKLIHECGIAGVEELIIAQLGDEIENYLHGEGSRVETQQSSAKQIVGVTKLIVKFVNKLSDYFRIKYFSIDGNHSRTNANYKLSVDGETWTEVHREIMSLTFEDSDVVEIIDGDSPHHKIMNIDGTNIMCVHGHRHQLKNETTLATTSVNHNTDLDILIGGHYHSYKVTEVGDDKYQVITGSIKGSDSFSEKIGKSSTRSQVLILFYPEREFDIRQVKM